MTLDTCSSIPSQSCNTYTCITWCYVVVAPGTNGDTLQLPTVNGKKVTRTGLAIPEFTDDLIQQCSKLELQVEFVAVIKFRNFSKYSTLS